MSNRWKSNFQKRSKYINQYTIRQETQIKWDTLFCPSNWQKLKKMTDLGLTKAFITVGGVKIMPYQSSMV